MIRGGCLVALVLPFVELLLLLWAASTFGWWPVALWVLLSFAVGLGIVRFAAATSGRSFAQALRLMQQRQTDTGTALPLGEITGGTDMNPASLPVPPAQTLLLVPAGLLIAIPGFMTDAIGLVMLLPVSRRMMARRWAWRIQP